MIADLQEPHRSQFLELSRDVSSETRKFKSRACSAHSVSVSVNQQLLLQPVSLWLIRHS